MDWKKLVATGFGLGSLPKAPGTWGTLGGVLLSRAILSFPLTSQIAVIGLLSVLGAWVCGSVAQRLGKRDPPEIVLDEMAAFPLVMFWVSFRGQTLLVGFILFRLFDILKPWPCRPLEKLPGGWGIMADDLMAALYSCVMLHFLFKFF